MSENDVDDDKANDNYKFETKNFEIRPEFLIEEERDEASYFLLI